MARRAYYLLALTPHQRQALLTVLSDYIGRGDAVEVSIEAVTGEEIPISDLLALVLNVEPTIAEEGTMPSFTRARDGDWIQPVKRGYRVACCDCGLVHRIAWRIRDGRIQFKAVRDVARTTAYRRRRQLPR